MWFQHLEKDLRPVYTCNFSCDFPCNFLLFIDVNEWLVIKHISGIKTAKRISIWWLVPSLLLTVRLAGNLLVCAHSSQGEIIPEIAAKRAGVCGPPASLNHRNTHVNAINNYLKWRTSQFVQI